MGGGSTAVGREHVITVISPTQEETDDRTVFPGHGRSRIGDGTGKPEIQQRVEQRNRAHPRTTGDTKEGATFHEAETGVGNRLEGRRNPGSLRS